MSVGKGIAALVLVVVVIGLVFGKDAPEWLPWLIDGALAVAILLVNWGIKNPVT